jgi:threonine/homoserine/homoserine lactone efflux protein
MSLDGDILAFGLVAGLLTILPGLDTAMVLRSAINDGRRHGFATALGVNSGCFVWGAGAATGVSVLLTASALAYTTLRLIGAVYLALLGLRLVRDAWRGSRNSANPSASATEATRADRSIASSWRRGFVTNLANPKVGVFYLTLLPQFIPAGAPHLLVGLLLATVHNVEGIAWFSVLILSIHVVRARMAQVRVQRTINAVTGLVLVGFGLRLAFIER